MVQPSFITMTRKNIIADTFSGIPHHDLLLIKVGENAPFVLFDFNFKGLNISNVPEFLNLLLTDATENNPIDLNGYSTNKT